MDSLPLDVNHPAVKEYLSLVRSVHHSFFNNASNKFLLLVTDSLQVLTPLSLLINIATVVVCTIIVNPGIGASYLLIRVSTDFTSVLL
jgi:hypothetical protein